MLFELRQYKCQPGSRDAFVEVMEREIIPMMVEAGMVIIGSWVAEEDETSYVWLRRFKDDADRKRLYRAVYETDRWKNEIMPKIIPMLEPKGAVVTRLIPTERSVIQ